MLKVPTRNTAICARLVGAVGQYWPPPQPPVIPLLANSSTHGAYQTVQGTSENMPVQVVGAGIPSVAKRKYAIVPLSTMPSGQ